MFLFWLVVFLFLALQVAAVGMALVSRTWVLKPKQVVWRGVDVPVAANNVQQYLIDIDDSRWAYPTGMFVPDADETRLDGGVVVMREDNFSGSTGLRWIFRIFVRMREGLARDARHTDSMFVIFMIAVVRAWIAAVVSIPLAITAVLDMFYRRIFASRIVARVRKHPDLDDAVTVDLELSGMSAFGLTSDVLRGMMPAALPPEVAAAAGVPVEDDEQSSSDAGARARASAWVSQANRRFRVIQATSIGLAVLAAIIGAAVVPKPSSYDAGSFVSDSGGGFGGSSGGGSTEEPSDGGDGTSPDDTSTEDTTTDDTTGDEEDTTDPGTYEGASYSITAPTDFTRDSEEKDKGVYEESYWHLAGEPNVYAKVNRTEGYDGSAAKGARLNHANMSRVDDYVEYDWREYGDGGWLWEYSVEGSRKIDIFSTHCGDGYAVLGAAPDGEFDDWRDSFVSMESSLEPDCERDGTGDEPPTEEDTPASTDQIDDPSAYVYPVGTRSYGMERALRRHFQARLDGNYEEAYSLYGAPLQQKAGDPARWAQAISEDGLQSVTVNSFSTENVTSSVGIANVDLTTESDAEGCKTFQIRYTMKKVDGRWKLWSSKADDSGC
ncbi:MAG: hypothetical protein JHC95_09875 [Solirubrobacteraceae bacterium]|nr:hypothetical protein [Solirubrobacteraceae bacterium]